MSVLAGIDIGGTKCAMTLAEASGAAGAAPSIIGKRLFPTPATPGETVGRLAEALDELIETNGTTPHAVGISCGGPLDSRRGVILSPPNLPGWNEIDIVTPFATRFGVPTALQNDANACALAEWRWGAGRGTETMLFLTFGTGMGAGLILGGRLHVGATDAAGEVGHIRLADDGPVGFGKAGSFEGFCSGGGIAQLARARARASIESGSAPSFCQEAKAIENITAASVGAAARKGDPLALSIYDHVAERLGQGLAILIDVLNPERIVIGSIYGRQRELLEPTMLRVLEEEALPASFAACQIVPAGLGENVGDFAALAVAESGID